MPGPSPEPDAGRPAIPVPRRRGEACKTALGAGGLVVAGSVLGAALLAAAGVGGPLPSGGRLGDDVEQFQGDGTLVRPGIAYGSVSGRDIVSGSGLLQAIAHHTYWDPTPASPAVPPGPSHGPSRGCAHGAAGLAAGGGAAAERRRRGARSPGWSRTDSPPKGWRKGLPPASRRCLTTWPR